MLRDELNTVEKPLSNILRKRKFHGSRPIPSCQNLCCVKPPQGECACAVAAADPVCCECDENDGKLGALDRELNDIRQGEFDKGYDSLLGNGD